MVDKLDGKICRKAELECNKERCKCTPKGMCLKCIND